MELKPFLLLLLFSLLLLWDDDVGLSAASQTHRHDSEPNTKLFLSVWFTERWWGCSSSPAVTVKFQHFSFLRFPATLQVSVCSSKWKVSLNRVSVSDLQLIQTSACGEEGQAVDVADDDAEFTWEICISCISCKCVLLIIGKHTDLCFCLNFGTTSFNLIE